MALINWSNDYSVKVKSIDNQHMKLVELINVLHSAMKEGRGKEVLGKVINELIEYTQTHFSHEEELMKKYSYPEYAKHKSIHDDLVKQVTELDNNVKAGKAVISQEVLNFLKNWLVNHIVEKDKLLGNFLNTKGVA